MRVDLFMASGKWKYTSNIDLPPGPAGENTLIFSKAFPFSRTHLAGLTVSPREWLQHGFIVVTETDTDLGGFPMLFGPPGSSCGR